jgi:hypothetical protein
VTEEKIARLMAKMEEAESSDPAHLAAKEKEHAPTIVGVRSVSQSLR